jgi:hypothetical protein
MRWIRMAAPAVLIAASLAVSFAQQPPAAQDEGSTREAPPREPEAETQRPAPADEPDDVFVPSEELQPDAAVTFPVDI